MKNAWIKKVLNQEMKLSTGCTEPGAIALCAAYVGEKVTEEIRSVQVNCSVNIIKNAMSACIPNMNPKGVDVACAIGLMIADPSASLNLLEKVTADQIEKAMILASSGLIQVDVADTKEKVYIEVIAETQNHVIRGVIAKMHNHCITLEIDGDAVLNNDIEEVKTISYEEISENLTFKEVVDFAVNADGHDPDFSVIYKSILLNGRIAEAGLVNDYGLQVGKIMQNQMRTNEIGTDLVNQCVSYTAAACDGRMAGCPLPAVSNSGSGNQGIASSLPASKAAELMKAKDKQFRAVLLSSLVTIYIKSKLGKLSALCGATVAGIGSAVALTWLKGGSVEQMEYAVHNMIGNVTGMLCDGAKADCALKVASCTHAAFLASALAMNHLVVQPTEGVVEHHVEGSISNLARLGKEGSDVLDEMILDMMLSKKKEN